MDTLVGVVSSGLGLLTEGVKFIIANPILLAVPAVGIACNVVRRVRGTI